MTAECHTNPDYTYNDQSTDWAICRLAQPVDLPVTPILYGCEYDMMKPGAEVNIVGFGSTSDAGGFGTKYWATTYVTSVEPATIRLGGGGTGACPGDSGGPLMVELADGSYRTAGITSTYQGFCGGPNTYARADVAVPWFESMVDIDLTPCHDSATGAWDPGLECTGFYSGGASGTGTWDDLCEGTPASGASDSCGEPYGTGDEEPPTVVITSPMDGAVFEEAPSEVDVTIDVDDGDGSGVVLVWLEIDGTELDVADEAEPWGFENATFPRGAFTVVAIAEDFPGNQGRSEPITIYVDTEPPEDTGTGATGTWTGDESGDVPTDSDTGDFGTEATGSDEPGAEDDGGGCTCNAAGSTAPWSVGLLLLGLGARRSRSGRRR
jgi:hypothetical protein